MVEDPRKYIVRRAVQDAFHLQQQVVVVILLEVADHGNRTAGRSVVEQRHVAGFLDLDQLREVSGQHRFAARHDRNAPQQGPFHDVVGCPGVVDDLDDQIDAGVIEDFVYRGGEK